MRLFELTSPNMNDAFWKWFGTSQVVDEHGNPLRVYHGTKGDIQKFDLRGKARTGGKAFFFTPDPTFAHLYANKGGDEGGRIYPVYLRIINMFDNSNQEHRQRLWGAVNDILDKENDKPYGHGRSFYPYTAEKIMQGVHLGHWNSIEHPIIIDALKKAGFDGATITEGGTQNFMVFNARQIKSTMNIGDWNYKNPNISETA